MKNWLNRMLGGNDNAAANPAASRTALEPGGQDADLAAQTEAAYYHWLVASSGDEAASNSETLILQELASLARDPATAAGLVPRVPEVVPQLLQSLRDEGASTAELARQASQDVVLVAEVIREANSAYYRPIQPVKNLEAAIMMLGQNGLRMLLARIAFRPVINMASTGMAKLVAPRIWEQSVKCALAASLMAPGLSAGVFEAYLAGLMQNVGLVVAFRLGDKAGLGKMPGSSDFGARLLAASRALSAGIAAHWDFPSDVAQAIAQAGAPGDAHLAQALAQGDRIAKLRMLVDAGVLGENDVLVTEGLDNFQRRCLGKLSNLEN